MNKNNSLAQSLKEMKNETSQMAKCLLNKDGKAYFHVQKLSYYHNLMAEQCDGWLPEKNRPKCDFMIKGK